MTQIHPDLKQEIESFIEEQLQGLDKLDHVSELIWQGFLIGLSRRNTYDYCFKATCGACGYNSITENVDGVPVWCHDIAEAEGWVWKFDEQAWLCPDCAENADT